MHLFTIKALPWTVYENKDYGQDEKYSKKLLILVAMGKNLL